MGKKTIIYIMNIKLWMFWEQDRRERVYHILGDSQQVCQKAHVRVQLEITVASQRRWLIGGCLRPVFNLTDVESKEEQAFQHGCDRSKMCQSNQHA